MAGLIPQDFIDNLLERIDIVEVIDKRLKLKKTGKNFSARCPFHEEKTPSFSVNQEKQFYYCFGCGASGNAIGFLLNYENLDFPEAVESLAKSIGLPIPKSSDSPGSNTTISKNEKNKPLYELLSKASNFYQAQLRDQAKASKAVNYLKARGLTGQIAKHFQIGYAPPGWKNLLTEFGTTESDRKKLIEAGLVISGDNGRLYDRFRDRIIFPIRDQRGRVIAFGGRVLGDQKPKYLNSPETPIFQKGRELYGLYEIKCLKQASTRVIVTEGYLDVIALAQFNINYATATLGTATSQSHLERIFRICPEIVFCFDGDDAGRRAASRALEVALPVMIDGRQARFLFLPEGEDPDSLVRAEGASYFESLIATARPLEVFLFDTLSEGIDLRTMEGRARLGKVMLPFLNLLPNGIFRELMMQELAAKMGVDRSSLPFTEDPLVITQNRLERSKNSKSPIPGEMDSLSPELSISSCTEVALKLLLHQPKLAAQVDKSCLELIKNIDTSTLAESISLLKNDSEPSAALLLGHWYGTPIGELLKNLAEEERLIPEEGIEAQFQDVLGKLMKLSDEQSIGREINALKAQEYANMSDEDKARLRELLQTKQYIGGKK